MLMLRYLAAIVLSYSGASVMRRFFPSMLMVALFATLTACGGGGGGGGGSLSGGVLRVEPLPFSFESRVEGDQIRGTSRSFEPLRSTATLRTEPDPVTGTPTTTLTFSSGHRAYYDDGTTHRCESTSCTITYAASSPTGAGVVTAGEIRVFTQPRYVRDFYAQPDPASEGVGMTTLRITLDRVVPPSDYGGGDLEFDYTITGIESSDVDSLSGTITVRAGEGSGEDQITIVDDRMTEGTETMRVTLDTPLLTNAAGVRFAVPQGAPSSFNVPIEDNENPPTAVNSFAADNDDPIAEAGGSTTVTLTLNQSIPTGDPALLFPYTISGIQAGDITDNLSGNIRVAPGSATGELIITAAQDTLTEGDETMTVTLGTLPPNASGTQITSSVAAPQITITDDETPPVSVASFAEDNDPIAEASGSTTLTLRLNRAVPPGDEPLRFPYTISGIQAGDITDNNADSDNNSLTGNITVEAGSDNGTLRITAEQDDLEEAAGETMTVRLGTLPLNASGTRITSSVAAPQITITDDDGSTGTPPTSVASFAENNDPIAEAGGSTTLTLRLNQSIPAGDADLTFPYTISGTNITAADITAANLTDSIVVRAGSDNGTATIIGLDDTVTEGNETMTVTLGTLPPNASGTRITSSVAAPRITITDDENPPTLVSSFVENNDPIAEAGGSTTLTLRLNRVIPAGDDNLTFPYTISGIQAGDIIGNLSGDITVDAGSATGTLRITAAQDTVDEGAGETMIVRLGTLPRNARNVQITSSVAAPRITITDDDGSTGTPPTSVASFAENNDPIAEAGGSTTLTLRLNQSIPAGDADLTFPYTISGTNITTADITAASLTGSIVVRAGSDNGTAIITGRDDTVTEGNETMTVTLGTLPPNASGEQITSSVAAPQITITDDENPPTSVISFAEDNDPIAEAGGSTTLTLRLNRAVPAGDAPLRFPYTITGIQDADIIGNLTGNITVAAGSDNGTLQITAEPDTVDEGAGETMTVRLGTLPRNARNVQITSSVAAPQITITDDDGSTGTPPTSVSSFAENNDPIAEAGGSTTLTLRLNRVIPAGDADLTFPYTISGTNITAADITAANLTDSIVVRAGSDNGTAIITGLDDTVTEGNETMTVTLGTLPPNASGTRITSNVAAPQITITDDENPPTSVISFAEDNDPIAEAGGSTTLTLRLNRVIPAGDDNLTFPYTISGILAGDIIGNLSGDITVDAGSATGTLRITAAQDTVDEGAGETMTVRLGTLPRNARNVQITSSVAAPQITITDDDGSTGTPPTSVASFAENNDPIAEAGGSTTLTLQLNRVIPVGDGNLTFPYTISGTNITAADITAASLTGSIVVRAGSDNGTAIITGLDDTVTEGNETMTVTLGALPTNGGGVQITNGVPAPQITITDDETPPVSVASFLENIDPIAEAGGSATLTLRLDRAVPAGDAPLLFPYTISGIQAGDITDNNADSDNNSLTGTITVDAGSATGTLRITAAQDTVDEGAGETMIVRLGTLPRNARNVQITSSVAAPRITITDDDGSTGTPPTSVSSFAENNDPIAEAGGSTTLTLRLNRVIPAGDADLTFPYTISGTNITAADITAASLTGSIVVRAGSDNGTATITGLDDTVTEGNETMTVTLGTLPPNASGTRITSSVAAPQITITDDENPPTSVSSFAENNDPIAEAGGSTTVTLTLNQLIPAGDSALLFPYTISGIQAGDITDNLSGNIRVAPGSATGELIITAAQDTLTEGNETMTVTLGALPTNDGNVQITSGVTAPQITITDDDLPPTLQNTVARVNPSEASTSTGGVTLTLSRVLGASESVTATYTLTPGGGATAADINQFSNLSGVKTLPTVASGSTIHIPITATDDAENDAGETIAVLITRVTFNDAIGTNHVISISSLTPNPATLTIQDDDAAIPPSEVVSFVAATVPAPNPVTVPVAISEQGGRASLTLTLDRPALADLSFLYTITGRGISAADLLSHSILSGTITVPEGEVVGRDTVVAANDATDEETGETMTVTLDAAQLPAGITAATGLGTDSTQITITDDDAPITITAINIYPGTSFNLRRVDTLTDPSSTENDRLAVEVVLSQKVQYDVRIPVQFRFQSSGTICFAFNPGDAFDCSNVTNSNIFTGAALVPSGFSKGQWDVALAAFESTVPDIDVRVCLPTQSGRCRNTPFTSTTETERAISFASGVGTGAASAFRTTTVDLAVATRTAICSGLSIMQFGRTSTISIVADDIVEMLTLGEGSTRATSSARSIPAGSRHVYQIDINHAGRLDLFIFGLSAGADTEGILVDSSDCSSTTLASDFDEDEGDFDASIGRDNVPAGTYYVVAFDWMRTRTSNVRLSAALRAANPDSRENANEAVREQEARLLRQTRALALDSTHRLTGMVGDLVRGRAGAPPDGVSLGSLPDEGDMDDVRSLMRSALSLQQSVTSESGGRWSLWASTASGGQDAVNAGFEWASDDDRNISGIAMSFASASLPFASGAGLKNTGAWKWPAQWNEGMTIIAPYITRRSDSGEAWATAGFGDGAVRLDGGSAEATADSRLAFLQAGLAWGAVLDGGPRLDLETRGTAAHRETSAYRLGIYQVPDSGVGVLRLDGETAASWPVALADGTLTPRMSLDLAYDAADLLPDHGRRSADVGAELHWSRGAFSTNIETSRALSHDTDSRDVSAGVRWGLSHGLALGLDTSRRVTDGIGDAPVHRARLSGQWAF